MAHQLRSAGLSVEPAIGPAAAGEFEAFCSIYEGLPDLEPILQGKSKSNFPAEASARYATVLGLIVRAQEVDQAVNALTWLVGKAGAEWVQFFATDMFRLMREKGKFGELANKIGTNAELKDFARNMRDLIFSA
jgi:hypothetical protein